MTVFVESFGVSESREVLPELERLLDGAYYNSHMYADLKDDIDQEPDPFRLLVARAAEAPNKPLGVAVIESKVHDEFDYINYPPVHVKRFTVARKIRGTGIGKQLIESAKDTAFEELGLKVLFGESNEIGALSFYGREGALYSLDVIRRYWRRNTPEQSRVFFAADMSDPARRAERYPNGQGIHFAFPADPETEVALREHGYITKAELMTYGN